MGKEKEEPAKSKLVRKWMTCPTCRGTGKMLTGHACTHCYGTGQVPYWTSEK